MEWEVLRKRSLAPSGFGPERVKLWPQLLGVSPAHIRTAELPSTEKKIDEKYGEELIPQPHRDERQIRLDTERSFVLYPTSSSDRETLQEDLHALIVSVFRKRPNLNYFQGYHDIISVLFLTLPPDLQFACAEKLSLHRVRDSMGTTLEPVLGLLRVTKNLLRLADPKYAETLERTSPLPFYALSNLLTLFSHDMPTLPLIQHVFDYLFCRPPIAIVYLSTAIILSRKSDIERLLRSDDEHEDGMGLGMAHSLLNALPEIFDDASETVAVVKKEEMADVKGIAITSGEEVNASLGTLKVEALSTIGIENPDLDTTIKREDGIPDGRFPVEKEDPGTDQLVTNGQPAELGTDADIDPSIATSMVLEDEHDISEPGKSTSSSSGTLDGSTVTHLEDDLPSTTSLINATPSYSPRTPSPHDKPPLYSTPSRRRPSTATLTTLSSFLTHADALYDLYPPAHPGLALSTIMGPQSVVYTWREPGPSSGTAEVKGNEWEEEKLADDEAEAMVARPGLVVYPYIEEDEFDDNQTSEEEGDGWRWWNEKKTRLDRKQKGKEKGRKGKERGREKRRPRKLRKNPLSLVEKRTMLAGAVLVLGVAMAIYGSRIGRGSSGGWDGHGRDWKEWRRMGSWIGGALVGVADRMVALSG